MGFCSGERPRPPRTAATYHSSKQAASIFKRRRFRASTVSPTSSTTWRHGRHDIPRRKTFSGANDRSSERRRSNEFIVTKDANRRERFKRRDDFATDVVIAARRSPKGTTFVGEKTTQRIIHARRRAANEPSLRNQITTKPDHRRKRRETEKRRTNRSHRRRTDRQHG